MYGFQVLSPGKSCQAADIADQRANLRGLEGIAELFHRRVRHAVLNDAGHVRVPAAVDPAIVRQVGPLASTASPTMASAAKASKHGLAFRDSAGSCGQLFAYRWCSRLLNVAVGFSVPSTSAGFPARRRSPTQQARNDAGSRVPRFPPVDRVTRLSLFSDR